MASSTNLVQLAKSLPAPLQRFFARWPPAAIIPDGTAPTRYQQERPNPFVFYKHPITGKWQDPVYSYRRQAELVKLARENGVEELLPETKKGTEYQLAQRVEHGLRVKGTGVGQKVKGRIHERHMISNMEKRRAAMLEMPKLIKQWKKVGKRGWTKFPK
ncbi:hypothetical protein CC79DRAFT_1391928 [Sarocladium strictum]